MTRYSEEVSAVARASAASASLVMSCGVQPSFINAEGSSYSAASPIRCVALVNLSAPEDGQSKRKQFWGYGDKASSAAEPAPQCRHHLRYGQRLGIGDDERALQREGQGQHCRDRADQVLYGQQRSFPPQT